VFLSNLKFVRSVPRNHTNFGFGTLEPSFSTQIRLLLQIQGMYPHEVARTRDGIGEAYEDHRLFVGDVSGWKFRDNSLLVQVEAAAKSKRGGGDRKCDYGAHD
jgi:hypothetical protein